MIERLTSRIAAAAAVTALMLSAGGCRGDIFVDDAVTTPIAPPAAGAESFYLLNEGNMGSNRASIDMYDAAAGDYTRNIYTLRNPNQVKELGDVGNDLTIYGGKMYAVINCSHKVEVLDAATCRSLGHIDIPNPRYVTGDGEFVYVSSYVSPVRPDPTAPRGAVYRVDTTSLTVVDRVDVGYQPEQMAIVDGRLYVANSGGYRAPDYDSTLTVVSLATFSVTRTIDVAPNLHRVAYAGDGRLLVTSRGDYAGRPARLYAVDIETGRVAARSDVPVTNFVRAGDRIYTFASDRNDITSTTAIVYNTLDATSLRSSGSFISDSLARAIKMPYALAAGPTSGNIYITDARNYVSSGRLHCVSPDGATLWSVKTGDIPAAIAFIP